MPRTGGFDPTAIHKTIAGEINAIPVKATPVAADVVLTEDSADGFAKKKITLADLLGGGGGGAVATGSYTGDGTESQAITGIGFPPVYVRIWKRQTSGNTVVPIHETTTEILADNVDGGAIKYTETQLRFRAHRIIALGADGFTVDDNAADADPNADGQIYNYLAIGSSAGSGVTPSARVRRATPQEIPNATSTALSFSNERWDDGGFWIIGAPTRLTAPKTGLYLITASVLWEPSLVGVREMRIRLNGATPLVKVVDDIPALLDTEQQFISTVYKLAAGDYVEIMVFQNSLVASDVNVLANSSPEATIAEMR